MKNPKNEIPFLRAFPFILIIILLFLSDNSFGEVDTLKEEVQRCLECHAKKGIFKTFEDGDTIEAYVDIKRFKASAHGKLQCSDCHIDFTKDKHPNRRFRNKEQYKTKSALVCKKCHICDQLKQKSIHAKLLSDEELGKSHLCTNCHGSHYIKPLGRKNYTNEEQYCLKCHGYKIDMKFKDGDKISLQIDLSILQNSVHRRLSCSDCHFGFSPSYHPQRNFKTKRDLSIVNSDTCRRCHFDKYTKSMESIHYAILSQGNLSAPICTDCHGSHSIQRFGKERILIARRCQKCHEGIYSIYANSVHGKALIDENNQDVPVCIDCHTAHNIKDPLTLDYREHIPELCSNCHANKALMDKYGLSTDVIKTYLQSFHGVTLNLYRKQREELGRPSRLIAVCTDCHGTHDIISTTNIEPAVLKANLIKKCQQCHKDAPMNFSDSWLSHYKPDIRKTPIIFIIEKLYDVFIPILIMGIVLQILLHIWRYSANR